MSSLWNLYHELGDILEHADREKGVRKQISGLERNLKKNFKGKLKRRFKEIKKGSLKAK